MNSKKLSSNKAISVIPDKNISSYNILKRMSMKLMGIFSTPLESLDRFFWKQTPNKELLVVSNSHNDPLEDMMNRIAIEIDTIPDESVIIIARGLHMVFWKWREYDRKTKLDYINSVIMPFIWENEKLPTILISDTDTVIKKFGIIIKEKVGPIMKRKVARLK